MARGIAARFVVEIAHGVAAGDDPVAIARGAATAEDLVVGIVEADGAQQLWHGVYDTKTLNSASPYRVRTP